jgi:hypothetical protein
MVVTNQVDRTTTGRTDRDGGRSQHQHRRDAESDEQCHIEQRAHRKGAVLPTFGDVDNHGGLESQ